jgi:hypothetical protein
MITPVIHFDHHQFSHDWKDKTAAEIVEASEKLRIAVKEATDYRWDNEHFVFQATDGRPGLNIQFAADGTGGVISCWSSRTQGAIGDLVIGEPGTETRAKLVETLSEWADQAVQGKALCSDCHKWVDAFKHFDFAGTVCLHCFNPKRHLPPDTSGS